jgi:phosphopantothenoylcysteine decarboxylase / phosphopantothenate---cysteine ligase
MSNFLNNKKILIGITGGIAAYKILDLIRRLKENSVDVRVILSAAAKEFVTPLSIQALTCNKVQQTLLDADNEAAMSHIELARWADVVLIAPATAHFIAKCANGLADDLLSTVCLATTAPVLIAPAMNQQMWLHPATQHNVHVLQQRQVKICGPAVGSQACGEFGPGRMLEAADLLEILIQFFTPQILNGKHLVITAGPTQEALDPVRYISNHSSGKMGYALAKAALDLGAHVTLISGPTNLEPPQHQALNFVNVVSAAQMYHTALELFVNNAVKPDIFIGCAAVADYRPRQTATQKIKKDAATMVIELERNPDILSAIAALPATQRPITIGFAAETENLIANATLKLQNKALDMIIANSVAQQQTFNSDFNQVVIIKKTNEVCELQYLPKYQVALQILQAIVS